MALRICKRSPLFFLNIYAQYSIRCRVTVRQSAILYLLAHSRSSDDGREDGSEVPAATLPWVAAAAVPMETVEMWESLRSVGGLR